MLGWAVGVTVDHGQRVGCLEGGDHRFRVYVHDVGSGLPDMRTAASTGRCRHPLARLDRERGDAILESGIPYR